MITYAEDIKRDKPTNIISYEEDIAAVPLEGAIVSYDQDIEGVTKPKMEEQSFIAKHPNLYGTFGVAQALIPYIQYIDPVERERFAKLSTQKQTRELLLQNLESIAMVAAPAITKGVVPLVAKYLPKTYKAFKFIKTPIKEMGELARRPAKEVAEVGLERTVAKLAPKVKPVVVPEVKDLASARVVEKVGSPKAKDILIHYQKKYPALKNVKIGGLKSTKESGKLIDQGVTRIKDGKATIHVTKDVSPITVRHEIEHLLDVIHKQPTAGKQAFARFTHEKFAEEYLAKQIDDPIKKITQAIKEAKPIRKRQEQIYSQERRKRLAKAMAVGEKIPGERGYIAQLKQLEGELTKVEFASIRSKVGQKDIDDIFNIIQNSADVKGFQNLTAKKGMRNLLRGTVPRESELKELRKVFPADFIQTLIKKRPLFQKMLEGGMQLANIPRSIMSSFDLSAPFRQGLFLIGHPRRFMQSFVKMFRQFGSEKAYMAMQESIAQKRTFQLMQESGLALTELGKGLFMREERFMSQWAEKIPGLIGRGVRASGRAYTGFLNKLRADVFEDLVLKAERLGLDPRNNMDLTMQIARFVNVASGRGGLGALQGAAVALNTTLFSPRLIASRLTLLNPAYYVRADPFVRREALKALFAVTGAAGTVLGLAKAAGLDVGLDPRSADFLKIKIGNTRFDVLGGVQQYMRAAGQIISGKYISSTTGRIITLGEGYRPLTRWEIGIRFAESKLAPIASFIVALMKGQDIKGEPVSVPKEIAERFKPMALSDIYEIAKEDPELLPAAWLSMFGIGIQTYKGRPRKIKGGFKAIGKQ